MTFNVAPRERLSRCDYSNIYSLHPEEAKLKEARKKAANIDVIESDSSRLERKLTERYLKGSFEHDGANIRFVKTVGKFVFVAVMFPPYMIAYLIPKWVIQYALPFVADNVGSFLNKVGGGLKTAAAWIAHVSGIIIEQFNKYFLAKLKIPAGIAKSSQDMLKQLLKKLGDALSSRYQKVAAPIKASFKKVQTRVISRYKRIEAAVNSWLKRIAAFLVKVLKPLIPTITFPKFTKTRAFIAKIKAKFERAKSLINKIKSIPDQLKEKAKKFIAALKKFNKVQKVFLIIGSFLWDILESNYQMWIVPCVNFVAPLLKKIKNKAINLFNSLKTRLQNKGVALAEKLTALKKAIASPFVKLGKKVVKLTKKLYEVPLKKLYQLQSRVQRLKARITLPKINLSKLKDGALRVVSTIQKRASLLSSFISKLPLKLAAVSTKASLALIEFLKQARLATLTFLILIKLIFKQGFVYLRSISK